MPATNRVRGMPGKHVTIFFSVVFTVYRSLPWQRACVWLLLAASVYFYATWNHWLALALG